MPQPQLLLLALFFACGQQPADKPALPVVDPVETPDQFACSTDQECVLAPWHFEGHPCCNAPYTQVQAESFVTWRDRWQAQSCSDVDCGPALASLGTIPPAQPMPCYFEPRCTRGLCGGSCQAVESPSPASAP